MQDLFGVELPWHHLPWHGPSMILQISESTKQALDRIRIVLMNLLAEDFAALICGDTVWRYPFLLHIRQNLVELLVLICVLSLEG